MYFIKEYEGLVDKRITSCTYKEGFIIKSQAVFELK